MLCFNRALNLFKMGLRSVYAVYTAILGFCVSLLFFSSAFASQAVAITIIPVYQMNTFDKEIISIYQQPVMQVTNLPDRLTYLSSLFLAKPYTLFPVGEGARAGQYDQNPLYRTDRFDCMTYVNTVIALALSHDLPSFQQKIMTLSYRNGQADFINRNHFAEADWNINNQKKGLLTDITPQLRGADGAPLYQVAKTTVNKPNWYRFVSPERIQLLSYPGDQSAHDLLLALRAQRDKVSAVKVETPYIPVADLFLSSGHLNQALFNQIPSGAIIEIVRPNWDLDAWIGTHLNVSHMGFLIRDKKGQLFLREASLDKGKVLDFPIASYFKPFLNQFPLGINIEVI